MEFGLIETLRVEGSPYEMGYIQGEYFSNQIKKAADTLLNLPSLKSMVPRYLPRGIFKYLIGKKAWNLIRKYMSYTPSVWLRFGGIVSGSKVWKEELAFLHLGEVLLNRSSYDIPLDSCTAVAVLPSMFGKMVVMKNFDYPPEIRTFNLLRYSIPKRGIPSVELTKTPVAISHDGMNREGLVVLYNYAASIYSSEDGPLIGALVQHVLETAKNVEEALEIVMSYPLSPSAGMLLIADKKKAVSVEISPKKKQIRYPIGDFLINTNHYQLPDMISHQIPQRAVFRSGPFAGKRILESSEKRYQRALEILNGGMNSIKDVFNLARDHGKDGVPNNNTICRHGEPLSSTIVSAIFVPEDGIVYYRGGNPCEGPYGKFVFN